MTDPDAWKKASLHDREPKNQTKQDAAKDKLDREQHAINKYQLVRELVQGQPTAAFEEFGSYLNGKLKHGADDKEIDISDADGKFLDVRLQARVGAAEPQWYWVYAYAEDPQQPQRPGRTSGAAGPSKQYVIETLAEYYTVASAKHR